MLELGIAVVTPLGLGIWAYPAVPGPIGSSPLADSCGGSVDGDDKCAERMDISLGTSFRPSWIWQLVDELREEETTATTVPGAVATLFLTRRCGQRTIAAPIAKALMIATSPAYSFPYVARWSESPSTWFKRRRRRSASAPRAS